MATYYYNMQVGKAAHSMSKHDYLTRNGKYQFISNGVEREDLIFQESNNIPSWAEDAKDFWNESDLNDTNIKSRPFREIKLALPNELTEQENIELMKQYCNTHFANHPYTLVIHSKAATLSPFETNIHAHIMFSEREIDRNRKEPAREEYFKRASIKKDGTFSGGYKKNRIWVQKETLLSLRKEWEEIINQAYKDKNINKEISSDTIKKQYEKAIESGQLEKAELLKRPAQERIDVSTIYKNKDKIVTFKKYVDNGYYDEAKLILELESDPALKEKLAVMKYTAILKDIQHRKQQEQSLPKEIKVRISKLDIIKEINTKQQELLHQIKTLEVEYNKFKHVSYTKESMLDSIINTRTKGEYRKKLNKIHAIKEKQSLAFKQYQEYKAAGMTKEANIKFEKSAMLTRELQTHTQVVNKIREPYLQDKYQELAKSLAKEYESKQVQRYNHLQQLRKEYEVYNKMKYRIVKSKPVTSNKQSSGPNARPIAVGESKHTMVINKSASIANRLNKFSRLLSKLSPSNGKDILSSNMRFMDDTKKKPRERKNNGIEI